MREVRLRPVRHDDVSALSANHSEAADPWGFFGFRASNEVARRLDEDGMLTPDQGTLVVESDDGTVLGDVGWFAVVHGPSPACRALNVGIALLPEHRGQGYGTAAQDALARYLFDTTLIERLEAGTDVDNVAEQRALLKAGFQREGVLRHAQFRAGRFRDVVLFSRLREDPDPLAG